MKLYYVPPTQLMNQSELLQWGILNRSTTATDEISTAPLLLTSSATESATPTPITIRRAEPTPVPEKMDSKWVDIILGRSDVTRMKELMLEVQSGDREVCLLALEELEGFVQGIDNANDLGPIGCWPILMKVVQSEEDDVKMNALWVIGTALQNNPKAQDQFEKINGFEMLLKIKVDTNACVLKLLRCFSALLQHSEANLGLFLNMGGFERLCAWTSNETLRGRMLFVLKVLLQEFSSVAKLLVGSGFISALYQHKDEEVTEFLLLVYSIDASLVDIKKVGTMVGESDHSKSLL